MSLQSLFHFYLPFYLFPEISLYMYIDMKHFLGQNSV